MKNKIISGLTSLTLVIAGLLSVQAQTTDEGPGPSDQPSAPMEVGQPAPDSPDANQPYPESDSGQPAPGPEAQPGPSGENSVATDNGVGRISMIHGDVSTQRGDSGDWSAAALNAPLLLGDKVSTAAGARAEVQLDFADILRIGSNSQVTIADLTKKRIQIQVGQGLVNYTVFRNGDAEPEIDTPNVAVHPAHEDGVFRIEVRPDGDTVVVVRKGEAQISTPQGTAEIRTGEMATVRGTSEEAQYKISSAFDRDDWDRWNSDRDRIIQNAQSWHHTNRYYVGSQDLDAYGHWQNVPDYGDVWVPSEPDGWAPYRDGNWVWEPGYGWTWVGYEPWGWAPYHYGRWFPYGSSWAWWPGPAWGWYRPLWAPAYVSFFGWGGGWGFGFGFGGWGGFGWLPIGPCDRFFPWWGGWGGRFGVVNITNIHITNINRFGGIAPLHNGLRYSNLANLHDARVSRGLSTVNAGRFGAGPMRAVPATRAQISGARMIAGNMPVVPSRASLSASGRPAAASTIRNGGPSHYFGSRTASRPTSFQQASSHLQQTFAQNRVNPVQAGAGRNQVQGRSSFGQGSIQKPSAGTFSNGRGVNSPNANNSNMRRAGTATENGNRGGYRGFTPPNSNNTRPAGNTGTMPQRNMSPSSTAENGNRGGFRPFTPPSSNSSRPSYGQPERSGAPAGSMNRPQQAPSARPQANGGGWRPFTSPTRNEPAARANNSGNSSRNQSGSYWNRSAPNSSYSRGPSSNYGRGGSSSRPQLDMRQPIVRPRSSGNYGGYGGSRGAPSYSPPRSAPSYGGGGYHGSPSYGGGHSAPSYGGGHSAPSYGGSHGGGYSGGGGGHSSGGGSHSSGGGGHSSGGGGHSSGGGHR